MLRPIIGLIFATSIAGVVTPAHSQVPAGSRPAVGAPAGEPLVDIRPPLFFSAQWQQTAKGGEHPVTADSIVGPDLELKLYIPAGQILLTGSSGNASNPIHVWNGLCTTPCAVAFRDKHRFADLSGLARIRWNTKTSGFHQVRPIIKLADGNWYVGDRAQGTTRDWLISEISYADLHWLRLDIRRVVTVGNVLDKVDLSKVDEMGFVDLMPGSGHGPGGWSDVAQVEVYGKAVAR